MFEQNGWTKLLSNYVAKQTAFRKTKTRLSRENVYGNPRQISSTRNRTSLSNASLAFELVFQLIKGRKWFFKKFFFRCLYSLGEKQKRERRDCVRDQRGKNPLHVTCNITPSGSTRHTTHRRRLLFFTMFMFQRWFFFLFLGSTFCIGVTTTTNAELDRIPTSRNNVQQKLLFILRFSNQTNSPPTYKRKTELNPLT